MRRLISSLVGIEGSGLRGLVALAAAFGLAAALLAPQAVAQDEAAEAEKPALKEKCLGCHDDPEDPAMTEDGKPLIVVGADFNRSAHKRLDCAECHTEALTVKHPRNNFGPVSPAVCQDCHEDEFAAIATSIHGKRAGGDKAIKDCGGCHGSLHTVYKGGDPESPLSPANQVQTCGACHKDMMKGYLTSTHAHALLASGLVGAPGCSGCHGTHEIHPKSSPDAATHPTKIPETCGECHAGVLREWDDSAHGMLWKDGKEGPVCTTCHNSHTIQRADAPKMKNSFSTECGDCHEEVYATFKDSFHGKATGVGNKAAASCSDCHTPHANQPASDPRSSIHKDKLAETCGKCHENVNASFLSFDPHADPRDPTRNIYVHWMYLAMTGLLLGVFGFFGLHMVLWFQRALVGAIRGEFKTGHGGPGQYVRRFTGQQMGMHVTVVVSFLLLAATGLPLKFAAAPWAPALMSALGGAEMAGALHRLAAIVTFGYFAWHLGLLAHGLFVKKEKGYFWGPASMVPQPRDIMDLINNFKYFLYLGPRPKFDRFTYWEKFDYLAVFWGVAIIGISGLVLWFPTASTQVLPGWALNAAYLMHSDEALLATGFIFLFHFFHTHLRPEAFPMDPVVFTGRMPLERFKEERPMEYERLVAAGTLDQYLMPPPTPAEVRRAYIFGFTAMGIGIMLAVFIFWAILGGYMHF